MCTMTSELDDILGVNPMNTVATKGTELRILRLQPGLA